MHRWKRSHRGRGQRGQALVEAGLVFVVFIALLLSALDLGQMLFFHQALVERVREAVRWASLNPYDGTGNQITNVVLYRTPGDAVPGTPTFLGLTRENVEVRYAAGTALNPNDERVTITIRNYQYSFFSPWLAGTFVNRNPVSESSPMFYKP